MKSTARDNKDYLYRIMEEHRVKDIFEKEELVFLKPDKWKDPFENYLSKVSFIDVNQKVHHIDFLNKIYGQCYSLGTESSLMWDAYTPVGNGIRIKIEKEKFINFLNQQKQYSAKSFRYEKVTYLRYGDFISKLKDEANLRKIYNKQTDKLLDYFFEKRYEYRDEREFRVMYNASDDKKNHGDFLKIDINPLELIDSVRFDPKMSESKCNELKSYFIDKGMDGRKIQRSLLYKYEVNKKVYI